MEKSEAELRKFVEEEESRPTRVIEARRRIQEIERQRQEAAEKEASRARAQKEKALWDSINPEVSAFYVKDPQTGEHLIAEKAGLHAMGHVLLCATNPKTGRITFAVMKDVNRRFQDADFLISYDPTRKPN